MGSSLAKKEKRITERWVTGYILFQVRQVLDSFFFKYGCRWHCLASIQLDVALRQPPEAALDRRCRMGDHDHAVFVSVRPLYTLDLNSFQAPVGSSKNYHSVLALRVFLGVFEALTQAATLYGPLSYSGLE